MLIVPIPAVYDEIVQIIIPKNIIPDPVYFDGYKIKFKDW